jgi:hypothetical protein
MALGLWPFPGLLKIITSHLAIVASREFARLKEASPRFSERPA